MATNGELREAAAALKSGDTTRARQLVSGILKSEPNNAGAWYLASFLSSEPEKQIQALERALAAQPGYASAQARLSKLRTQLADPLDALFAPSQAARPVPVPIPAAILPVATPRNMLPFALLAAALALCIGAAGFATLTPPGRSFVAALVASSTPSPTHTFTPLPTETPTRTPIATRTFTPTATPTATITPHGDLPTVPVFIGSIKQPVPLNFAREIFENNQRFRVAVTRVMRGAEALAWIKADSINDGAYIADGREYVLAYVEIDLDFSGDGRTTTFSALDFGISSRQQLLRADANSFLKVFAPKPSLLGEVFPGASTGGWIVKEVYAEDVAPLLVWGARDVSYNFDNTDDTKNFVYFSLTGS